MPKSTDCSSTFIKQNMKKIVGIIPSRFASTRFPGKPLAIIDGKTMIQHVFEQASLCSDLTKVVVATDDERIFSNVKNFGGEVVMTSPDHNNGTSRCNEVITNLEKKGEYFDIAINIQGDEPRINPEQISSVAALFGNERTEIATLAKKIVSIEELKNPNVVKVIMGCKNNALYFSRQAVPFNRDAKTDDWLNKTDYFKHIGIYGYKVEILKKVITLNEGILEKAEKLEQLRWLENDINIAIDITEYESIAIDTPEDLAKLETKS